jgi:putative PIN family toxin of toxin-antitoxin system
VRVVLDTNVYIGFLLSQSDANVANRIIGPAVSGAFTLLATDQLLQEVASRVTQKPYLARRIDPRDLARFLTLLAEIAEMGDLPGPTHPSVVRDPDDDYLVALAVAGNADMLVTGDHDLLAIADLTPFRILPLRAFADLLDAQEARPPLPQDKPEP